MDSDKECKFCTLPFTFFKWRPGNKAILNQTEICPTCSRLKNACQACLLGLGFRLPVQLQDTPLSALSINTNDDKHRPEVSTASIKKYTYVKELQLKSTDYCHYGMKELGLNRFGCFPAKGAGFCYYDTKGHPELKDIAHIGENDRFALRPLNMVGEIDWFATLPSFQRVGEMAGFAPSGSAAHLGSTSGSAPPGSSQVGFGPSGSSTPGPSH
uniref:STL11/RBM22-like N-terminal domain-containing protein n=1 Tax=Fagus sylvatica TaxID=28930 RepID=A0A2N9F8F8_FAGSY